MAPHWLARSGSPRDLLLDGAAAVLGATLVLLATTGLNRLPYPGAQRYAREVSVILTAPATTTLPELLPETGGNPGDLAE